MKKVVIIGGGAAGMMAAVRAAEGGCQVHLYEKNEKLGKKIYITGKGRCNFTNACDMEKLLESVCTNRKFLYSAFYGFTNQDAISFFEKNGMKTKVERGERAFPLSDKSADVIDTLRDAMKRAGVKVHLNEEVEEILTERIDILPDLATEKQKKKPLVRDKKVTGILLKNGKKEEADCVLVATGGLSYKSTGSTGD
ncbi:MAG: NAD(P)/FAD-dependent oxidoreductase, partial [Muricoprocola sp.]